MRVSVYNLQPGDQLLKDTFTDYGLLVLPAGSYLNESAKVRLLQHNIYDVEIAERTSGKPAADWNESVLDRLQPYYHDAVCGFEQMFEKALEAGKVYEEDLKESFQPLIENCRMEKDLVSLLLILNSSDDYTYQHSVQVGMLSYYIARWIGWDEQQAVIAGKAGFLHDIGKCRIPDEILNKPGKLTDEEYKEIQHHTIYGYEILQNSHVDPNVTIAALQHHERMDGTGYPHKISGDQINPVSRIVAVADTYSAMISSRVYQEKRDLLAVLKELYRVSFNELDPEVTHTFIRHMLPNFIGKRVELTSGISGTIIMNHPTEFFSPLVMTEEGTYIDLSVERDHEIIQVSV